MKVKARVPSLGIEGSVEYNFYESIEDPSERLEALVEAFGTKAVCKNFQDGAIVSLRARMKRFMTVKGSDGKLAPSGISDEELQEKVVDWKPGVAAKAKGKSLIEKFLEKFPTMDKEEQREALKRLQKLV